jgi:hypothetical protein
MRLVNKTGYLKGTKTAKNPVNIIPSNIITTQNMAFPIKANGKTLYPNTGQYKFPTSPVVETPLKKKFQEGANKLEGDLISKVVMNRNKDKDFVKRTQATNMFKTWDDFDTKATHKMAYGEDNKGQSYMFPTIMNPNNEAVKVPNQYADYISREGYKKATGMSYQGGSTKLKAGPVLKKAIKENSKPKPVPKPVPKEQLEDNDSWLENAWEVVDPSGTSSYDDVYRSYKNTGLSGETALEAFGALPLIGKIGKSGKIISGGFNILQQVAPKVKYLPKGMQTKAQKKLFDTYQNYSKNGGKDIDNFLGKTTEWFRDNIPYINPSSQKYIPAARHAFNYSQTGAKVKNAISNALGSKDNSGFKYDPYAKDNTLKFNGRNIFPTMSNEYMYKKGSKGVSLAFSRGEKDPKGGLTQKGVDKYNRATGGNLKMAVTTPPSKLKPGSKAANRRKSFCARMSGVKGPMAKNGKPTRKALALRKWNC